jgi:hypothetical protein
LPFAGNDEIGLYAILPNSDRGIQQIHL